MVVLETNPVEFLRFNLKPMDMEAVQEMQGSIESTAAQLYGLLDIRDRKYHLQVYKKVGEKLVAGK